LALIAACAIALAGCSLDDPSTTTSSTGATTPTTATMTSEDGLSGSASVAGSAARPSPRSTALSAPTPQAALRRFARVYVNWSARYLKQVASRLAAMSTGQARAQALQLATRAAALERYEVANSGTVVAVARGEAQQRGRWAVVTRETTSGTGPYAGLPTTSHVAWAAVARRRGGYVVSGWYPAG
jgi:hypothetical protein